MSGLGRKLAQRGQAALNVARAAAHGALGTAPRAPLMIYMEVTRRCNLRCRHCDIWMTSDKGELRPEMPADRIREVLSGLVPHGLLAVDLFGGEPLLRPELPVLVRDLRGSGLHVTVTTNGTLLMGRMAEALADSGLSQLLVSIDAPTATAHDRLRGRAGTFEAASTGLARFASLSGGRVRTGLNTLVCRENMEFLPDMVDLCLELGARQIRLLPYHQCYPFDRYLRDDSLLPRPEDLPVLNDALARFKARADAAGITTNCGPYLDGIGTWFGGAAARARCMAGLAVCDVNAFGDLYPCFTLSEAVGNVLETPFLELWRSPALERHRAQVESCRRCWQSCYIEPGLRLSPSALLADRAAVLRDLREYFIPR